MEESYSNKGSSVTKTAIPSAENVRWIRFATQQRKSSDNNSTIESMQASSPWHFAGQNING